MKERDGMQWTLMEKLDDLDFTDDLAPSSIHNIECRIRPACWYNMLIQHWILHP
jgi:hypothetical protein